MTTGDDPRPWAASKEAAEIVLFRLKLPSRLRPVPIWSGNPPEPIDPETAIITHATIRTEGVAERDSYNLVFLSDDGKMLAHEQFETIEIALDQAHEIAGVQRSDWEQVDGPAPG